MSEGSTAANMLGTGAPAGTVVMTAFQKFGDRR